LFLYHVLHRNCAIQMDALPDIGHACGHNLIGIAGIYCTWGEVDANWITFLIRRCCISRSTRCSRKAQYSRQNCPLGNAGFVLACNPTYTHRLQGWHQPRKVAMERPYCLSMVPTKAWMLV
jgi:hypothetical protein